MEKLSVLLAVFVGFLAARMLWLALRNSWAAPALLRQNFRGVSLPTAAGIVIPLTLLLVEGLRAIFGSVGIGEDGGFSPARAAGLVVILGFSSLGLLDDLLGSSTKAKGIAGHFKALKQGEFTTGSMKFFGGIVLAFVAASLLSSGGLGGLVIDAAVIALAANLGNLLDLRPGRTTKVSIIAFIVMGVVSGLNPDLIPVAIAVGAAFALFLDEMHERVMLGDTGANALGAVLGLGIVATTGTGGAVVAAVVLLALTLLGDTISFTKIFEKVGPLRAFDNIGRRGGQSSTSSASSNAPMTMAASPRMAQPQAQPQAPATEQVEDIEAEYQEEDSIDLRSTVAPPSPPRGDMDEEMRTTIGNANAGASASSFRRREPNTSSSLRGDTSSTRSAPESGRASASDKYRYADEFEDTPDFFSPRRSPERTTQDRSEPRLSSDRHSPFDDDEEDF